MFQPTLFDPPPPTVALRTADILLVNSSAGKDSQAMLDLVVERADAAEARHRIVVVHCDLGDDEWPGTRELAQLQARRYGLRFEVVSRAGGGLMSHVVERKASLLARADEQERQGNLKKAAHIRRMPPFPSSAARWCTSDHKRGPVRTLMTRLVKELDLRRPARIYNCLGLRALESTARAKRQAVVLDESASNSRRTVITWHPILDWTERQVWQRIGDSGVPYHPAYDSLMRRLSCSFCVLATFTDLVTAARLRPAKARQILAVERRVGHTFKAGLSMAQVIAEAERLGPLPLIGDGSALRHHLGLAG